MPVVYGSIQDEHRAVRERVGLFDVSHMSNLFVEGPGAAATIAAVTPKDTATLEEGQGRYGVILQPDGAILDDVFTFCLQPERFLMVPNAGRNGVVAAHLATHASGQTVIADETRDWAILALQGPAAKDTLAAASHDVAPRFHRITAMDVAGVDCLVSGTGYTGEKGVELYVPARGAPAVWDALMAAGQPHGIAAVGLGARDTLRLEKGYCLAGNEFEGGRTPLEAGLEWLIDWNHGFVGRDALLAQRETVHDRLVGLVQDKGVPRHGYSVQQAGQRVGVVTSGTMSPTLGTGIALAYVRGVGVGEAVDIEVRRRVEPARVVKTPFC